MRDLLPGPWNTRVRERFNTLAVTARHTAIRCSADRKQALDRAIP